MSCHVTYAWRSCYLLSHIHTSVAGTYLTRLVSHIVVTYRLCNQVAGLNWCHIGEMTPVFVCICVYLCVLMTYSVGGGDKVVGRSLITGCGGVSN